MVARYTSKNNKKPVRNDRFFVAFKTNFAVKLLENKGNDVFKVMRVTE